MEGFEFIVLLGSNEPYLDSKFSDPIDDGGKCHAGSDAKRARIRRAPSHSKFKPQQNCRGRTTSMKIRANCVTPIKSMTPVPSYCTLAVSIQQKKQASALASTTCSRNMSKPLLFLLAWLLAGLPFVSAFVIPIGRVHNSRQINTVLLSSPESANDGYKPQYEGGITQNKKPPLYPKAGDIVRYYDLDGGRTDGEVLVGKISFIQKVLGDEPKWTVEITQLEDVGDGFYAEFSARQRSSKKVIRPLEEVSPIAASFVRAENAWRIPMQGKVPRVRAEQYDIETFAGPFAGLNDINQDVLYSDWEIYTQLKGKLIRQTLILIAVGTLVADLLKGPQDAAIYAAGALAGLAYLFFLSLKTDTIGSPQAKLGTGIANIRFATPLFVFVGVALYNKSLGDLSPVKGGNIFSTVSPEQFAAATIGLLTYRVPLFANQIADLLKEGDVVLPGSAGVAFSLAKSEAEDETPTTSAATELKTVLLVSGPQAAGRSELVTRLIAESEGRFVAPNMLDRVEDGPKFELHESRNEFLKVDSTGRFGLTREGILSGAGSGGESVVVVDGDVDTVKRLRKVPGIRLIGVWVGLDSTEKFESRLNAQLESGELQVPEEETRESFLRAKIKEIVKDIEYGIVSGMFEFTVLNDDPDESMKQLRDAAEYCFT
jgi:guanylate kinase